MPIHYTFDHPEVDLHVTIHGHVDALDVVDYFEDVTTRVDDFGGMAVLLEIGDVSLTGVNYASVRQMSHVTRRQEAALLGSRTAVVAHAPLAYGVVRMYLALRDPPYSFRVFRHRGKALDWLRST